MDQKDHRGPNIYPADKSRQSEHILRSPRRRIVFIGGMLAALVVVLAAEYLYLH
jgi:hypothetical protein